MGEGSMHRASLEGGFVDAPINAAHAFRAALAALARPGDIRTITGATPPAPLSPAAGALILTLCDGDTGLALCGAHDTPAAREWATFHTGAPLVAPREAGFGVGTWQALLPLDDWRIGTPEYPDRSATLIVEVEGLSNTGDSMRGPGIRDVAYLPLPDKRRMAANAALYPLGVDFFLTSGQQLAGVPRSTQLGED